VAAPVLDDEGRLVGVITVDDVLDHLLPADWRERQLTDDTEHHLSGPAATLDDDFGRDYDPELDEARLDEEARRPAEPDPYKPGLELGNDAPENGGPRA